MACEEHRAHTHKHGPGCGHHAMGHEGHMDYLHDGHLHNVHDGTRRRAPRIRRAEPNPEQLYVPNRTSAKEHASGSRARARVVVTRRIPARRCTSTIVVGSHLHHAHGEHCDDHGAIRTDRRRDEPIRDNGARSSRFALTQASPRSCGPPARGSARGRAPKRRPSSCCQRARRTGSRYPDSSSSSSTSRSSTAAQSAALAACRWQPDDARSGRGEETEECEGRASCMAVVTGRSARGWAGTAQRWGPPGRARARSASRERRGAPPRRSRSRDRTGRRRARRGRRRRTVARRTTVCSLTCWASASAGQGQFQAAWSSDTGAGAASRSRRAVARSSRRDGARARASGSSRCWSSCRPRRSSPSRR